MGSIFDIDAVMLEYGEMRVIDGIHETLIYDSQRSSPSYPELHFLVKGIGTDDPKGWIKKALKEYDAMVEDDPESMPKNLTPVMRCLYIKRFRRELQKLRKAHGGRLPTEKEAAEYYANLKKSLTNE